MNNEPCRGGVSFSPTRWAGVPSGSIQPATTRTGGLGTSIRRDHVRVGSARARPLFDRIQTHFQPSLARSYDD
jgi:hypothetical protein